MKIMTILSDVAKGIFDREYRQEKNRQRLFSTTGVKQVRLALKTGLVEAAEQLLKGANYQSNQRGDLCREIKVDELTVKSVILDTFAYREILDVFEDGKRVFQRYQMINGSQDQETRVFVAPGRWMNTLVSKACSVN
jgi:hypothetical protein